MKPKKRKVSSRSGRKRRARIAPTASKDVAPVCSPSGDNGVTGDGDWAALSAILNLNRYPENDVGNAQLFVDCFKGDVRYIHEPINSWFVWNGSRWLLDDGEKIHQKAQELSLAIMQDASRGSQHDERKRKRGFDLGRRNTIENMLWMARSDPGVVIGRDSIDTDNFLLGARNGVINLRTGELRGGEKGDFVTKACSCNFDAAATAPRWLTFLEEIFAGQTDLVSYIQRAIGYTLTGDTREQCLFFLHGPGANGKSTFIEILVSLLGDYGTTASQNVLCYTRHTKEPLDEIASLAGARFVSIAETGDAHMAEVRIKLLTGGDTVTGKAHYKAANSFRPKFKLWIFGNSKPTIYGVDYAMWRRIRLIPFNVQFPVEQQDPMLKQTLLAELPGILNWAIQGALDWQTTGRLTPPECVITATEEYQAEEDILREFINERVVPAKNFELEHKELYRVYKQWNEENGSGRPVSSKRLSQMFRDRNYKDFYQGGSHLLFWCGIGLKPAENVSHVSENADLL
jgi:putative DNA primase/helicase